MQQCTRTPRESRWAYAMGGGDFVLPAGYTAVYQDKRQMQEAPSNGGVGVGLASHRGPATCIQQHSPSGGWCSSP
jgi:hypothetical protein